MAKLTPDIQDESLDLKDRMIPLMLYPSMALGVSRKINTGNYENIDVFAGITVPLTTLPSELDAFKEAAAAAAELGFSIVSQQTGERYQHIKDMQSRSK